MLGDALKDLLKKKQSGQKIEAPREREPSKVVNLMEALRRSVETERAGGERRKPAPRTGDHRAPKKAGRLELRARRAGYASIWAPPEQELGTRNGQAIIQPGPGVCPSCPRNYDSVPSLDVLAGAADFHFSVECLVIGTSGSPVLVEQRR